MSGFVVHAVAASPYAQAVLITLAEKGWTAEIVPPAGGLQSETHLARHPFGKIPALEHDGFMLYETQAILRYLDRLLPEPALTPADLRAAARMDQVMNITDHYLMAEVGRTIGFQRIVGPMLRGLEPDLAVIEAALPAAHRVFGVLDGILRGQDYLAGETVSLADVIVTPHIAMLAMAPEWAGLTAATPDLLSWAARMNDRASVREARGRAAPFYQA